SLFTQNIKDNITADPPFLMPTGETGNLYLYTLMLKFNRLYYHVHLIFIPIYLIAVVLFINQKDYIPLIITSAFYFLGAYYIIVTGISFWQGDRLVLPSISIWSSVYPYLFFYN